MIGLKLKLVMLAIGLVLVAALSARAASTTDAYFSDAKAGAITGTLGDWTPPYLVELGSSTARHWGIKDVQSPRVLPIAQHDPSGAMFLDFGDEVRRNSNASPDVFRVVSTGDAALNVAFSVTGEMAPFVTEVHFGDARSTVLEALATEHVFIKVSVPVWAEQREYAGVLTLRVEGWFKDVRLPMVITVRDKGPKEASVTATLASPSASPIPAQTPSPQADPTPALTPVATPTANESQAPTPLATPTAAPSAP